MKVKFSKNSLLFLMIALFFLAGCASAPPQATKRYVWPRPPDPPKIEWIKSYYSQNDFPKTGFAKTMEIFLGQERPIMFEKPIDIKSNGKGMVYVTDIILNAIVVYDLNNETVSLWRKSVDAIEVSPYYIALDSDDNIYVVGTGNKNIYVVDKNGKLLRKIASDARITSVAGIAVNSVVKRIYMVDSAGGKVEVFSLAGEHLFTFGNPGEGDGEFNRPSPIAINSKGEVVIGDTMNARIQIFDSDGKFLRKFGQRDSSWAGLQVIKGVAVDSEDNVYVTDGKANQIKIFNTKGENLLTFGAAHSVPVSGKDAPGGFLLPQGIHIDSTDTIYVADQANMRFQVFKYLKDAPQNSSNAAVKESK